MVRPFIAAIALLAALAAPAAATAQARFDFDAAPGRLSKDVVPSRYALSFDVDPARDDFGGQASIVLRVRKPVAEIVVHAHDLQAGTAVLSGGSTVRALRIEPDEAASLWRLRPGDGAAIAPGDYTVSLTYRGRVHATDEGLYRVDYRIDGRPARMLATQLEEVHARALFPGFDEPAFRAQFEIAVRAPQGLQVLSNMPQVAQAAEGAKTLHRFAVTPPMPSYLVALAVGRFDVLEGEVAGVPLRIFTAPGKRERARYALQVTQKVLPYYNDYFGLPYALPKLDQLAVPGVREGAMEDWGLISYIEPALLLDEKTSSPDTPREIFATAAHEIAHQWFGNLVTASSWDEIWLNEAFATWMENKATDHFNAEWQRPLHVRRYIDRAMLRDAGAASRAIRSGPVDENKVADQFDDITYTKGGAVLSMLEEWLGPEAFQRGLATYMRERKLSNATAGDLWFHLSQASGQDVTAVAASWTDQVGFPLVQIREACHDGRTRVSAAQQRFALHAALPAQQWQIPVRLRMGTQRATLLVRGPEASLEFEGCSDAPVLANAGGRGFYRVQYDETTLRRFSERFAQLEPIDRITLLSDSFALAQAGRLPMSDYFALLARLPQVHDAGRAALFAAAAEHLKFLDDSLAGTPAQDALRRASRSMFAPELARLGWAPRAGEDAESARLRGSLIEQLARYDDAGVLRRARELFALEETRGQALPSSIRGGVLLAVGMHAGRDDFERLRARLKKAGSEEDRWLYAEALAAGRDHAQAERLLAWTLTGALPPNIASAIPGMVAKSSPFGELAYGFTLSHWNVLAKLAGTGPFGGNIWLLPNAAASFNDAARAARLVDDQRRTAGDAGAASAATVAATIELRAAVRSREQATLPRALQTAAGN
jgi:aminopeptidase N